MKSERKWKKFYLFKSFKKDEHTSSNLQGGCLRVGEHENYRITVRLQHCSGGGTVRAQPNTVICEEVTDGIGLRTDSITSILKSNPGVYRLPIKRSHIMGNMYAV